MRIILILILSCSLFACSSEKVKPAVENIVSNLDVYRKQSRKGVFDPYSIYDISGENPGIHRDHGFLNYRRWYCGKDKNIQSNITEYTRSYCDQRNGFSVLNEGPSGGGSRILWCYTNESGQPLFGVEIGHANIVSEPADAPFCTSGYDVGVLAYTREGGENSSQWLDYLNQKGRIFDYRFIVFNKNVTSSTHVLANAPINGLTVIPLYESLASPAASIERITKEVFAREYKNMSNEFDRRGFLAQFMPVVRSTIENVDKTFEYKVTATTNLGMYDFDSSAYPIGLRKNSFIRLPGSEYVVQFSNVTEGMSIPMERRLAPSLLDNLSKSRQVLIEVFGRIKSGKVTEYFDRAPFGISRPYVNFIYSEDTLLATKFKTLTLEISYLTVINPTSGEVIQRLDF